HPAGEGHFEHHHEPDAARARRARLSHVARAAGAPRAGGDLPVAGRVRKAPPRGAGGTRAAVCPSDNVQGVCRPRRTERARGRGGRARAGSAPGLRARSRLRGNGRRPARGGHRAPYSRGDRPPRRRARRGRPMKLIYEKSQAGRRASALPRYENLPPPAELPEELRRSEPPRLPEVAEFELVRHFTELSTRNFGVDTGFYPLGSCTMKYNPRINERLLTLPSFANLHPLQEEDGAQGALELMWRLQEILAEVTGLDAVSLQPAAGSQGEFTGLLLVRAYFAARGEGDQRRKVVIPDTAHGTNPASVTMA